MQLKRVKLQGFIGLQKGMGVEAIDLDLSAMSGLVALEGDNGRGKTTLLENLQPFRTLPSRKSTLKTHCYLKNSFKELWFSFDGDEYHTLVKMDPTTTVPDEGFIWKNKEPQVNGKVSQFDKYLVKLLGTPTLFFNSIFCAQNSSKLSDLRPAELKALFAEFLRLDRYVAWEKTAKSATVVYSNAWKDLEAALKRLKDRRGLMGNVQSDFDNATKVLAFLEKKQIETKIKSDNAHNLETKAKEAIAAQVINKALLEAADKDKDFLVSNMERETIEYHGVVIDHETRSAVLEDEAREVEIDLDESEKVYAAVKIYDNSEKALDDLELECDVLDIEVTGIKELHQNETDRLEIVKDQIEDIGRDRTVKDTTININFINAEIEKALLHIENIGDAPEMIALNAELNALLKSAAVLNGIDPGCTSEICGLITQSIEDEKAIPAVTAKLGKEKNRLLRGFNWEIKAHRDEVAKLTKVVEDHVKERDALLVDYRKTEGETEAAIKVLEADILKIGRKQGALLKDIEDWKKTKLDAKANKDRLPAILVAEARKTEIDKQLDEIVKQLDALEAKQKTKLVDTNKRIAANAEEIDRLEALIDPEAEKSLKIAETEVKLTGLEAKKVFEEIVKCQTDLEKASEAVDDAKLIDNEINATAAVMAGFRNQEGQWTYLAEACSKDGLRALEIEGVAPVITGYANDMLSDTFGPNHSVRFETQDEDGKEVLDIVVIGADGSETLLTNLSGGERVWILKALSLAQTLISQEKSGRHFETALMDEEDGALSNDNAMRFISLYRTLMNMAKMLACFYISHRPEAIALADHRIKLTKGGISII